MPRPVHYHAAGGAGYRFNCWQAEWDAHLVSAYEEPPKQAGWHATTRYTRPAPQRHTDLRQVTCPACWLEIAGMVKDVMLRFEADGKGGK